MIVFENRRRIVFYGEHWDEFIYSFIEILKNESVGFFFAYFSERRADVFRNQRTQRYKNSGFREHSWGGC